MSRVEVAHLSKHYGPVTALDDVTLSFADGEFFGLLGPSRPSCDLANLVQQCGEVRLRRARVEDGDA